MKNQEIIPHLFRNEYKKIVSVLCKKFGFEYIETAEDIAGETFLIAAETWGRNGIPENPVPWLYSVAKNNAINYLKRSSTFQKKILPEIGNATPNFHEQEIDLTPKNINDSQLQVMFAICHSSIPPEAQVGLSLRILCGFGIEEIADAFLTNKNTINKRLYRAKQKLREEKVKIEMPDYSEIDERLDSVLKTIYLLFNEGYYSVSQNSTLRKEFCLEAIRLCNLLSENEQTNKPYVFALLALMCFHASRFEARFNKNGDFILYDDQDTELWNAALIRKGVYFLKRASSGNKLSKYHLEASIAWWHTQKENTPEKWENILQLYNKLLLIEYSPIAALNRTFALSKVHGKEKAVKEAEKLNLTDNHFYFTLLGVLYSDLDKEKARKYLFTALSMAKTENDKKIIQKRINDL